MQTNIVRLNYVVSGTIYQRMDPDSYPVPTQNLLHIFGSGFDWIISKPESILLPYPILRPIFRVFHLLTHGCKEITIIQANSLLDGRARTSFLIL